MIMMFEFYRHYVEFFFFVLMVIGLIFALFAPSAIMSYILVLISGAFAGRILYERRHKIVLPYVIIIAGFLLGYLIGTRYGSKLANAILFFIGALIIYKLFDKKILKDFRF